MLLTRVSKTQKKLFVSLAELTAAFVSWVVQLSKYWVSDSRVLRRRPLLIVILCTILRNNKHTGVPGVWVAPAIAAGNASVHHPSHCT